jgi:hypothetical protein
VKIRKITAKIRCVEHIREKLISSYESSGGYGAGKFGGNGKRIGNRFKTIIEAIDAEIADFKIK